MTHESSTVIDSSLLGFTWKLQEFTQESMKVEIMFTDPLSISSGIERDNWIVTVRDPEFFISEETF